LFGVAAEKLGFPLPAGVRGRELFVIGIIGGIGFTVALFVSGEAFADPALQGAAKMGAMLSCGAAAIALIAGKLLKIKKVIITNSYCNYTKYIATGSITDTTNSDTREANPLYYPKISIPALLPLFFSNLVQSKVSRAIHKVLFHSLEDPLLFFTA